MNRIEELIQKLCPDGVEFKELHEVVILTMGTSPAGNTFSNKSDDGIEFHQGKTSFGKETIQHSNIYTTNPVKLAMPNSIVMSVRAPVGATNLVDREIAIGRGLCSMTGKNGLITKFLYYFINENIQSIKNKSNGSTFEAINTVDIKKIQIPIPPLPIQQEIVNILDKFTSLEAELEAELEARKKQYEYYRNELLNFEGKDVEWKMLGEACNMKAGKSIKAAKISMHKTDDTPYPCIGGNGIRGYVNSFSHKGKYPIIGRQGALCGNINFASGEFYATEHAVVVDHYGSLNERFLFHYLYIMNLNQYASAGAQPGLAVSNLKKLNIPIPTLEDQERIVAILDKFDALVNDISIGLPAEIKARRNQYEYYRGRLLDFKSINNG